MENLIQQISSAIVMYNIRKEKKPVFSRTPGVNNLEKSMELFRLNYNYYQNLKKKGKINGLQLV
jgi:hypothetical protein